MFTGCRSIHTAVTFLQLLITTINSTSASCHPIVSSMSPVVSAPVQHQPHEPAVGPPATTAKPPPLCPSQLPAGVQQLPHQVAGHQFAAGVDSIGMLHDRRHPDTVLKASIKPMYGEREIRFYQRVFGDVGAADETNGNTNTTAAAAADAPSSFISQLRPLVARFYGVERLLLGARPIDFMRLQDLTHAMREPCVMDVKIGARTHDPLATPAKRAAEQRKYADCKRQFGFCIPGFQVYRRRWTAAGAAESGGGTLQRVGRDVGKQMATRADVRAALLLFLNATEGAEVDAPLLLGILDGLAAIWRWSLAQNVLRLFSSSVLLTYDAAALPLATREAPAGTANSLTASTPAVSDGTESEASLPPLRTQVRMIDFAHAFDPSECPETAADAFDRNYAQGVGNLYAAFAELLPSGLQHDSGVKSPLMM